MKGYADPLFFIWIVIPVFIIPGLIILGSIHPILLFIVPLAIILIVAEINDEKKRRKRIEMEELIEKNYLSLRRIK